MKISRDQINYLCLTDLSPANYSIFLEKLRPYYHHIVNEKMCIIVTEDEANKVLISLTKNFPQPDKINLIALIGSSLCGFEGGRVYGQEYKSVFDKPV